MAKPPPLVRSRPAKPPPERPGSNPERDSGVAPPPPPRPGSIPDRESGVAAKAPRVSLPDLAPPRPKSIPDGVRASIPDLDLSAQQQEIAKKNLADDLAQVEAAMAALEGRDPTRGIEVAHARRDVERVRVQLQSIVEQGEVHVAANEKRRRWLAFAGALAGVLVIAAVAGGVMIVRQRRAETEALEAAARAQAQPFLDAGFEPATTAVGAPVTLAGASKCFVAVAASKRGAEKVRVERGADKAEGQSAAFCLCGEATATVTPLGGSDVALEVMSIPAAKIGGADMLSALRPAVATALAETDDRACAEWAVDAVIDATPPGPVGAPIDLGKRLVANGFVPLGTAPPEAAFLRVVTPPGGCFVAVGGAGDTLSLRLPGGARPLGQDARAVAFCDADAATTSVWRRGRGRIDAFAAPAEALGGLVGLAEALKRAGLDDVGVHRTEKAIAAEPRASILASGASPAHLADDAGVSLLGSADAPFLFAFAASEGRAAPPISPSNATCTPSLATSPAAAVCLGDRTLFEDKRGTRANRPEWLRIGSDAPSIEAGLTLMAIARRLHAIGLVPTPPIGATFTASGVDVVGRPNESTVAGVVIADAPPYVHTLSDGAPWAATGEPRVLALAPGAKVSLTAAPRLPTARGNASIVLFRR